MRRVTAHAVVRFVQRILEIRLPDPTAWMSPEDMAAMYCAAAATTPDKIRRAILQPAVRLAMDAGMSRVHTADFSARLRDGRVVTICEGITEKRTTARLKGHGPTPASRKQARREIQRHHRRLRRGGPS